MRQAIVKIMERVTNAMESLSYSPDFTIATFTLTGLDFGACSVRAADPAADESSHLRNQRCCDLETES